MQGEIGKVIEYNGSEVVVCFDIDLESRYQENALMTLVSKKSILSKLRRDAGNLQASQQRIVLKVFKLMMSNEPHRALKFAMQSEFGEKYCTVTLAEWIARKNLQNAIKKGRSIN